MNSVKTYTWRTQAGFSAYAACRKSLICIVGHRGVEPRTSRLSDPRYESTSIDRQRDVSAGPASRFPKSANLTPSALAIGAYTKRTHAKSSSSDFVSASPREKGAGE